MSSNYDEVAVFGSADSSTDLIREADAKLTELIIRKTQELKIRKIIQGMPMGPTDRNGNTVVTTATAVLDDGREVTKLHCICGVKRGIQDPERLVFESAARSTMGAIKLLEQLPAVSKVVEAAPVVSKFFPSGGEPQQQKVYKHRSDKAMSEIQKKKILEIVGQRRLDLPDLCADVCRKGFKQLTSADAHNVIQYLLSK